jgi:hypothetical protein
MKTLKCFLIFSILGVVLIFSSCKKDKEVVGNDNINSDQQLKNGDGFITGSYTDSNYLTSDGVIFSFFLNDTKMQIADFNPPVQNESDNNDNFIFIVPKYKADSTLSEVIIRQYTDIRGYVNFGKSVDPNFEKCIKFRDDVVNYSTQNNVITQYERDGTVPESFNTWYSVQFNSTFYAPMVLPVTVYKDISGGSAWMHPLGFATFMAPGWNNTVSRYMHLTVYGWMYVYNKTFYRQHMATIAGWGFNYVYFIGPLSYLNDKMSSFWTI